MYHGQLPYFHDRESGLVLLTLKLVHQFTGLGSCAQVSKGIKIEAHVKNPECSKCCCNSENDSTIPYQRELRKMSVSVKSSGRENIPRETGIQMEMLHGRNISKW